MIKNYLIILSVITLFACNQSTITVTDQKNYAVENMLNRRSIRSYKAEQINKEQLDTIINCAVNAPSARNYQPWEIRVIQNKDLLKQINTEFNDYVRKTDTTNKKVNEDGYSIFYNAPTLIVIAKDTANHYAEFDCGLLSQNILLSANSMGIGSVCLGWLSGFLQNEESKNLISGLNIPSTHKILIVIGLGYPNEKPDAKPRDINKVKYIN